MSTTRSVPGRFEAATSLVECIAGLLCAPTGHVKSLGQSVNPRRVTGLQAGVDGPRVATGLGDQVRDAYAVELHGNVIDLVLRSFAPRDSLPLERSNLLPTNIVSLPELVA
jgi:hypothetical protein